MKLKRLFATVTALLTFLLPCFAQQNTSEEYIVKLVYFLPRDRQPQQDINAKIDKIIKRAQNFYADQMEVYGYGRKTFRFETDAGGNALVHHIVGKKDNAHYRNKPDSSFGEFANRIQTRNTILLVVIDISKSGLCGVTYTGKRILMPASGGCFNWITAAHELGHTFLLQHDFRDGRYIMSYGPGPQNRISDCAAGWLDVNAYFNPNQIEANNRGRIELLSSIAYPPPDNLHAFYKVTDPDGLQQIRFLHGPLNMHSCEILSNETEIVRLTASPRTLTNNRANVQIVDVNGNIIWGGWFSFNEIEPDMVFDITTDGLGVDDGLIGHWMFDEANGQYAFDVSGQGNYAVLQNGATLEFNSGKIAGALRVDDRKQSASVFNGGDFINGLSAFTLSLWVRSAKVNTDRGFIFPKTPNNKDETFSIRYDAKGSKGGGRNVIKAAITTTDGGQVYESANNVQTMQWQHIALTWRRGRELTLYINGVLDQPTFNSPATEGTVTGVNKLLIGRGSKDGRNSWNGLIDDVRLYNRVLSAREIADLPHVSQATHDVHGVALSGVGDLTSEAVAVGAAVKYDLTVTNTGNTNDTIRLATSGNIRAMLSDRSISLPPGRSSVVRLTIPSETVTTAGEYMVNITAASEGDITKTAQIATTTTIKPVYGVSVAGMNGLTTERQYTSAGVEYILTVVNTGNTDDTIQLTTSGDLAAMLSDTLIPLRPGASSTVTLTILAEGLNVFTDYAVKVRATSEGDHTKTDQITTITYILPDAIEDNDPPGELISHWDFDETRGNIAPDVNGNHDAILQDGATFQPNGGIIGGAIRFDGSGGSVSVPNGGDFINGLRAFTLSLWVKSDKVNSNRGFIFPKTPNEKDVIFSVRYDADGLEGGGRNVIKAGITTTGGVQVYESANNVQTMQWQHIALTWRSGRELTLYINGILDQPTFNSTATRGKLTGAKKLLIGRGAKDTNRSWNGRIDEVRIYDRVLSPSEITDLTTDGEIRLSAKLLLDINADGEINILDLVKVANQFGESGEGLIGDVNKDNTVNILDLVQVASYLGEI